MSGTKEGGIKARNTVLEYNPDHYKNIGSVGGKNGTKEKGSIKGFAANPELARTAGQKGGKARTGYRKYAEAN